MCTTRARLGRSYGQREPDRTVVEDVGELNTNQGERRRPASSSKYSSKPGDVGHGLGCSQPAEDHGAVAPSPSPLLHQSSGGESGLRLFCFRQPELVKRKKGPLSWGRGSNPVMCLREKRGRRSEEGRPGADANSLPFAPRVPCQPSPGHKRPPPLPGKLTKHLNLIAVRNLAVSKRLGV